MLRIELRDETLECDWVARPADIWDSSLRRPLRDRNESMQTLLDAISLRNLAFEAFPGVDCAVLRAFRRPTHEPLEMVVLGTVSREMPEIHRVNSLVMRAKLYGFCFHLEEGVLKPLQMGVRATELIS
jgi:hypothetical protein